MPPFDNFYLDMNGIVHACSHPEDPAAKPKNEPDMMMKIFAYLDRLFNIVKPQGVCFMAIDGCAPRAKMNQQRARRFRAAQERQEAIKAQEMMAAADEDYEAEEVFDSNCITPGTAFMVRLSQNLKFFIAKKVAEDAAWQIPDIIFSGHEVPGEGEHKVMEYIRHAKAQPDYPPDSRHCLYGLDADLIMLSLLSHEPHFALLREVVTFGRVDAAKSKADRLHKRDSFQVLYVALLREYMDLEFRSALRIDEGKLGFPYNFEQIVDDFILMCYLVGNDFLPPLPTVDIRDGGLDEMIKTYKEMLPGFGGYLVDAEKCEIHPERFEKLLAHIAQGERAILMEKEADLKFVKAGGGKGGKGKGKGGGGRAPAYRAGPQDELDEADEIDAAIQELSKDAGEDAVKMRYYWRKLGVDFGKPQLQDLKRSYMEGLNWVLKYYYQGVPSWNWFYPSHYAPLATDMVGLAELGDTASFDLGKPFLPFQQLLGVLPPLSSALLPAPYRALMTNPNSPVYEFFIDELKIDMEGKSFEWEAIVLLKFMEEEKLLAACEMVLLSDLTPQEQKQNFQGSDILMCYDPSVSIVVTSPYPGLIKDIQNAHVQHRPYFFPPKPPGWAFGPRLQEGVSLGRNIVAGWPSILSHPLDIKGELCACGVNIFGRPSQRDSMLITIDTSSQSSTEPAPEASANAEDSDLPPASAEEAVTSRNVLGKTRFAQFPCLVEAIVSSVSDGVKRYSLSQSGTVIDRALSQDEINAWQKDAYAAGELSKTRWGVDPGEVHVMLGIKIFTGMRALDGGRGTSKTWATKEEVVPWQLTLTRPPQPDPRFLAQPVNAPLQTQFPVGQQVLYLEPPFSGVSAVVTGLEEGKVAIEFDWFTNVGAGLPAGGDLFAIVATQKRKDVLYFPLDFVAQKLEISYNTLSKILSVVPLAKVKNERGYWDSPGDIGLQLKFEKRNLCMPGFTQRQTNGRGWQCSAACVQIIQEYKTQFPEIFAAVSKNDSYEVDPQNIFKGQVVADKVAQVLKFLAIIPTAALPLVPATARCFDLEMISTIEKLGDKFTEVRAAAKSIRVSRLVTPKALLKPTPLGLSGVAAAGHWQLADRVVCIRPSGQVPFGLRGTVVGFGDDDREVEVIADAPFVGGEPLRGRCTGLRGKQMPVTALWRIPTPKLVQRPAKGKKGSWDGAAQGGSHRKQQQAQQVDDGRYVQQSSDEVKGKGKGKGKGGGGKGKGSSKNKVTSIQQKQEPKGPLDAADDAQIAAGMNASPWYHGGGKSPLFSVLFRQLIETHVHSQGAQGTCRLAEPLDPRRRERGAAGRGTTVQAERGTAPKAATSREDGNSLRLRLRLRRCRQAVLEMASNRCCCSASKHSNAKGVRTRTLRRPSGSLAPRQVQCPCRCSCFLAQGSPLPAQRQRNRTADPAPHPKPTSS